MIVVAKKAFDTLGRSKQKRKPRNDQVSHNGIRYDGPSPLNHHGLPLVHESGRSLVNIVRLEWGRVCAHSDRGRAGSLSQVNLEVEIRRGMSVCAADQLQLVTMRLSRALFDSKNE